MLTKTLQHVDGPIEVLTTKGNLFLLALGVATSITMLVIAYNDKKEKKEK